MSPSTHPIFVAPSVSAAIGNSGRDTAPVRSTLTAKVTAAASADTPAPIQYKTANECRVGTVLAPITTVEPANTAASTALPVEVPTERGRLLNPLAEVV